MKSYVKVTILALSGFLFLDGESMPAGQAFAQVRKVLNDPLVEKMPRGAEGDSDNPVPGIIISETLCPVVDTITLAADGVEMPMSYRKPPGDGPFPAIVFFHGGVGQATSKLLSRGVRDNAALTRFLEKGFVVAAAARRRATGEMSGPDLGGGLLLDGLASVEFVKQLPFVDSESVVIFGGSMGGALGLLVAGKTQLAALVAGEPASHVLTQILLKKESVNKLDISQDSEEQSAMSILQHSRNVLGKNVLENVTCPVLILMGDLPTDLNIHNKTVTIPEFESLGKKVTVIEYPGLAHGFYVGSPKPPYSVTVEELDKVVNDAARYILEHIRTLPTPIK